MSKELEALKKLTSKLSTIERLEHSNEIHIVVSALKAWEIIKKYSIEYCASMVHMENYQHYLESFLCSGGIIAAETEFNLLKEMLEEK